LGVQLRGLIEFGIALGELPSGVRLPSVRELAERAGIAPMTVATVYRELRQSGLIESKPGAGTYVGDGHSSDGLRSAAMRKLQRPSTDCSTRRRSSVLRHRSLPRWSNVYDPEIPVNIYELGLIYKIDIDAERNVNIKMTLTAPACPVAGTLPGEVEKKVEEIDEVKKATVELVWDPPWSRDMMSESALLQLGMY